MSRQHTQEEIREKFLAHLAALPAYWAAVEGKTTEEKLEGLLFSVLVVLDGGSGDLPAFEVIPSPHPTDEAFHKDEGSNWWPSWPEDLSEREDIVTVHGDSALHELYSMRGE